MIGVWAWNNQLEIGTTTEIDFDEAFEGYYHTRLVVIIIVLVTLSASIILTLLTMLLGIRANSALQHAHDSLELRVEQRTLELKASEQKLMESEERFYLAMKGTQDGLFDWNYHSGEAYYSEQWFKMLGYEKGELPSTLNSWKALCHLEDIATTVSSLQMFDTNMESQLSLEYRMKHKDGRWLPILSRAHAVRDSKTGRVRRFVGIHTDLSKQREYENTLKQALDMANDANRAKSEFLATMSHEIRTPLNGVMGMLSLLQYSELNSEQSRKLSIASQSAQSLLNIINDVLDFSKIEAGKLELEQIEFDPTKFFEEFSQTMAFKAEEKNVELLLDITQLGPSWLTGDPTRIRQILLNLVGNAIKFTERGEVLIKAKSQSICDSNLTLTVSVTDSGIGIPDEKLATLFDSFTQADSSTTRKYGGSGLGLAICKSLVEKMGGTIGVKSKANEGSTFEFSIPMGRAEPESQVSSDLDMSKIHVLIVDDNATNREIFRAHLAFWGIASTEAYSADAALNLIQAEHQNFDIALVDMHMPDKNGEMFAKELKNIPNAGNIKLMLMTSMNKQRTNEEILDIGFDGYLSKPVATSDLYNAIVELSHQNKVKSRLITESSLQNYPVNSQSRDRNIEWPENTRILVVEDNHINQMVAKGMLDLHRLDCDFADNGLEALNQLEQSENSSPFTLVLMDCQMPELDGYETTKRIRNGYAGERYQSIPIIAMTAHAMNNEISKCLAIGMDDYLPKPLDEVTLELMLQKWCLVKNKADSKFAKPYTAANDAKSDNIEEAVKVWDKAALSKRLYDNQELVDEIVKMFGNNVKDKMAKLESAVASLDIKMIKENLHAIKGMAGNIGANEVHALSAEVEKNAEQMTQDAFNESFMILSGAIERLQIELDRHLASNIDKGDNKHPVDFEHLRIWLLELKSRLMQGEFLTHEVFSSIDKYAFDADLKALIDQLKEQISMFDTNNAVETVEKIKQQL